MENPRNSSTLSRLKRKPLSDFTNKPHNLHNFKNKYQNPNLSCINNNDGVSTALSTGSNNCSGVGDTDSWKYGPSETQLKRQVKQNRKDTPTVRATAYLPSRAAQVSAVLANDSHISQLLADENQILHAKNRKNMGKVVGETPVIHTSAPLTSHSLQTSSSAASDNCYIPGPSAVHSCKQDTPAKNKGNIVHVTPTIEASGPTTPRSLDTSSSAAFGTEGQEERRGLIVHNQKRTLQRKKLLIGNISLPFSCPPDKRTKMKGVELDYRGSDGHSRSLTDPLHKKKRSHYKKDEIIHAMPQEEVEKLKAYYADVDAFELPEEVASEGELE